MQYVEKKVHSWDKVQWTQWITGQTRSCDNDPGWEAERSRQRRDPTLPHPLFLIATAAFSPQVDTDFYRHASVFFVFGISIHGFIYYVFLLLFTQSYVCGTMQATATSLITLINLTNITLSNDPGTKKAYNLWHHVLYVLCRISQRLLICFAINGQLDSSRLLYTMLL